MRPGNFSRSSSKRSMVIYRLRRPLPHGRGSDGSRDPSGNGADPSRSLGSSSAYHLGGAAHQFEEIGGQPQGEHDPGHPEEYKGPCPPAKPTPPAPRPPA